MTDKCDERLESCTNRMDSQADDVKIIFATKASKSVLFWTLGIFFVLILGSFGYTKTVDDDVSEIVTRSDMVIYQKEIIEAIKSLK